MSDSRVEKLAASYGPPPELPADDYSPFAAASIRKIEAAGLVVLDPDDPEVIERVAQRIYECEFTYPVWAAAGHSMQSRRRDRARAVLSALKGEK